MILISGCLCGVNCKYNGENNLNENILKLLKEGRAVIACPEQLGGLKTPRIPSEIVGGTGKDVLKGKAKVLGKDGTDVTKEFLKGAYETLNIAKSINAEYVILKAKSPSCGLGVIYSGNFNGEKKEGNGVTCELLLQNGFKVKTENDF
ncbi:DUF523 domain-containing protein [Clostridium perfringens]|uniref:DUF523 domain-containing protein n=1 Tax=Clostridium perfringens TaxID=1502 RepID=UPI0018D6164D|nr:DUF523 domain-containing protein [Clostridium perfringens]MCR1962281.1 DUF523 domain-containing protein [Clostridium perfringens]MDB2046400.1 DUF523 domain-containing protein [Clostridium perfringens]MDB2057648.1 DUF523 domain-containing protein [Clostridium perfringens]QPR50584.1 DUF523 domain-containing protein [Clostridium perfringens]